MQKNKQIKVGMSSSWLVVGIVLAISPLHVGDSVHSVHKCDYRYVCTYAMLLTHLSTFQGTHFTGFKVVEQDELMRLLKVGLQQMQIFAIRISLLYLHEWAVKFCIAFTVTASLQTLAPFLLVLHRFALGLFFCAILALILLLAVIGLLTGSGGVLVGGISHPKRNRIADCGGRCLLA